jgi:UDP-N-acetylmuramoyl-L-alanyl-D-glutamate--2,6-diaminopimelate ligase
MRLRALLGHGVMVQGSAWEDVEITALATDSRTVGPGMLFAALPGSKVDGSRFIAEALAHGASAILADRSVAGSALADARPGVPLILDPQPRRRLALIAARFFEKQPRCVVAVTGTNGKTSVVSFTRQLWTLLGHPAAALGTLGLDAPAGLSATGHTTPDPVALHRLLAELAVAGVDHLALEASSHGLDQHRLDGVRFQAAAFTNLSRDHFDYHGDVAHYLAAKQRLFSELLPAEGTAVLNADQPSFESLAEVCRARGIPVLDYGRKAQRLRLVEQTPRAHGQTLTVAIDGRTDRIDTELVGGFQAANLLAALGLVLATGGEREAALAGLGRLQGAPGRLQLVGRHPSGAPVFVDYAHAPDALEQVLRALRPHTAGRLVVVFGCGGDRDRGKRPIMGRIVAELADRAFVTDDNPRSEDPASIRQAVLEGCPGGIEVGDRRAAIREALAGLEAGDVLVIAGKGHETGQIVGDRVLPFDDAQEARGALAGLAGAAS